MGIDIPIIQAPLAGADYMTKLSAAICNAGGLGVLHLWRADIATLRSRIRELKARTDKPFAVKLHPHYRDRLSQASEEDTTYLDTFCC